MTRDEVPHGSCESRTTKRNVRAVRNFPQKAADRRRGEALYLGDRHQDHRPGQVDHWSLLVLLVGQGRGLDREEQEQLTGAVAGRYSRAGSRSITGRSSKLVPALRDKILNRSAPCSERDDFATYEHTRQIPTTQTT